MLRSSPAAFTDGSTLPVTCIVESLSEFRPTKAAMPWTSIRASTTPKASIIFVVSLRFLIRCMGFFFL